MACVEAHDSRIAALCHGDRRNQLGSNQRHLHGPEGTLCWAHPAIDTQNTHGTGCSLSSAIAAQLAMGQSLPKACELAITFVTSALGRSKGLQLGHGKGGLLYEPER